MTNGLLVPQPAYIVEYPQAVEFVEKQMGIFWFPDEIKVEKDVHDILVELTPAEKHGVITTLKLFTNYELIVGTEYWSTIAKAFPKPADIQRMANCFSFFELNVHAPFYSKINEALGLASEKFYTDYVNDTTLKERMDMLEHYSKKVSPLFLAMLALTEGAVLYSSFAFLKHFQSQGKNKMLNIVRGINFSARDEGLHSEASAWLFKTWLDESGEKPLDYQDRVHTMCDLVRDHEHRIVDMIFEGGVIEGITKVQMCHFVDSRINIVLRNLGMKPLYEVKYNPIGDWFYDGINNYISNDFFTGVGREYSRDWSEADLEW